MMIVTITANTTRQITSDSIPLHHQRRFFNRLTSAVTIRPRMNQTMVAGIPMRNPRNSIPRLSVGKQPKPGIPHHCAGSRQPHDDERHERGKPCPKDD
jgi:hypothetical protein